MLGRERVAVGRRDDEVPGPVSAVRRGTSRGEDRCRRPQRRRGRVAGKRRLDGVERRPDARGGRAPAAQASCSASTVDAAAASRCHLDALEACAHSLRGAAPARRAFDSAILSAGLWLIRQGPWALLAVWAASLLAFFARTGLAPVAAGHAASLRRTAVYGPERTVVWEGRSPEAPPYPDLRIGIVPTLAGGALGQIPFPFRMGVGGVIGSRRQYMSWVALDDVLGGILHALRTSPRARHRFEVAARSRATVRRAAAGVGRGGASERRRVRRRAARPSPAAASRGWPA